MLILLVYGLEWYLISPNPSIGLDLDFGATGLSPSTSYILGYSVIVFEKQAGPTYGWTDWASYWDALKRMYEKIEYC